MGMELGLFVFKARAAYWDGTRDKELRPELPIEMDPEPRTPYQGQSCLFKGLSIQRAIPLHLYKRKGDLT
jgi:hypothetical protein